ncbi:Putative periplasmic protein YibQ, distant homology with nucleoside diphosphatase and polysaccharide deacetylase [hydrothermal vent metagenome]|uniref:Periplasmic protein YibQ, distant homology with nucleoside diphosphatase and polysaccharide deacetylase n=1 Tax=hydrothermal vent metagenome TaxID=652676 RepID=A0A3B1A349_9ZZZZ
MRLLVSLIAFCLLSIRVGYAAPAFSPTNPLLEQNAALENKTPVVKARYYISLIIDDMGYRYQSGKRAINLPANITYSFLPYAPHARKLANFANKKQKEIMLHIPMEATNGKKLGPGGLTVAMPKAVFDLELEHNLLAIPHIKGVNNHMGSLLTQQLEPMTWLMEMLVTRGMYFIDSRTSGKSQALKAARQYGLPSETRDIFVDHDLSTKAMQQQLAMAVSAAKRNGSAVVIAHPFPETMRVLEKWLPQAKAQGLEFVYMSELLTIRKQYRAQRKLNKRVTQWQAPLNQSKNN